LPTATPTPSDEEVVVIDAATGGQLNTRDGRVQVRFPAGAVSDTVALSYRPLPISPTIEANGIALSFKFSLTAEVAQGAHAGQPVTRFAAPLELTLDLVQLGFRPGWVDGRMLWFGYFDDAKQAWIALPTTLSQDGIQQTATLHAAVDHFTQFGVGVQADPGWYLKFDEPQVALFSGAASYSYGLEVPPGRNGLQPQLALSYNSRNVDLIRGWINSDWVGQGWSLGNIEIARRSGPATNQKEVECTNDFTLLFNGQGHTLLAGTPSGNITPYYTQEYAAFSIEYHSIGGQGQTPGYWQIRDAGGTLYRLGYMEGSDQRVKCTDGQYREFRWMLDKVTDLDGNQMKLDYQRETRENCPGTGDPGPTDTHRAIYLWQIWYNNLDRPFDPNNNTYASSWAVQINFDLAARPTGGYPDDGVSSCDKLFFQAKYLADIEQHVYVSGVPKLLRRYDFTYQVMTEPWRNAQNFIRAYGPGSRVLTAITETGYDAAGQNGVSLPATRFTYQQLLNAPTECIPGVNCGPGPGPGGWSEQTWDCRYPAHPAVDCIEFHYWRLSSVANGYGARTAFVYETDGRSAYWWGGYNYRVARRLITADEQGAAEWRYTYAKPCYNHWSTDVIQASGGVLCQSPAPAQADANLIGHETVTVTQRSYSGVVESITWHTFNIGSGTDTANNKLIGRETRTDYLNAGSALLRRQDYVYSFVSLATNPDRWRIKLDETVNRTYAGGSELAQKTAFTYDTYGNTTAEQVYADGGTTPYRQTLTNYAINDAPTVWRVSLPSRVRLQQWNGSAWVTRSETWNVYAANPANPGTTQWSTSLGATDRLVAVRRCETVACTSFVDTRFTGYDEWGHVTSTVTYANFGTAGAFASSDPRTTLTAYSVSPFVLPDSTTNPLGHTTLTQYDPPPMGADRRDRHQRRGDVPHL
jgi:hypothetical protein